MKIILLKKNAICIQCESKFDEEFLRPIIETPKEDLDFFVSINEITHFGFLTISPKKKEVLE